MPSTVKTTLRWNNRALISATVKLAFWRLRQTWGLLLVTGVGIVAAVMLVCAVILYSRVALSAGLQNIFITSSQKTDIIVRGDSKQISTPTINKLTQVLNQEYRKNLGPYLDPTQFSIETPPFVLVTNIASRRGPRVTQELGVIGTSTDQAGSHVQLLQGQLPQDNSNSDVIELAITPETAASLHMMVGSFLTMSVPFIDANQVTSTKNLTLHIVGIFKPNSVDDPFWHGNDFAIYEPSDFVTIYTGLVSNENALAVLNRTSDQAASHGLFFYTALSLIWYYHLNPAHVTIDDLDNIINGVATVKVDDGNNSLLEQSPFIQDSQTYQTSDLLKQYHDRVSLVQLPVGSLLLLMLGLVLFFVSMMADLLVDRQVNAIAILSSRGASSGQIFASLMIQSIGLGLIALVAGPLLSLPLVYFIAQHSLPSSDQSALNLITNDTLQIVWALAGYALLAVLTTTMAMAISIFQATRQDVLTIRLEAARSTRRPFWQKLNLDIISAIVALTCYAMSIYIANTGVLDAQLRLLLLSPLTLLESACLLMASILIFLRFFPQILRLGTWLAMRSTSAVPMLALAQMARSPRQPVRMTLLLALTIAFAIFTLIFSATQAQRILDVAAYQGGADFSGGFSGNVLTPAQLQSQTTAFRHIRGIIGVSLGYNTPAVAGGRLVSIPVNFSAVDTDTFATAAIWEKQDSSQPLSSLMAQLAKRRASTIATHKIVPAIVDSTAWDELHLSPGGNFALNFSSGDYNDFVNFTVIAEVQHIPTSGDSTLPGILVDFRSYTAVYTKNYAGSNFIVPINYVWLRTTNDPILLTRVRDALSQGGLQLDPLYDRRATIVNLSHEPLYLALTGVLALGATTAMFLALVGNLIASWLSARNRVSMFAALRALGASPRQIVSTLTWEQGIIYTTGIVLGILLGAIFSLLVIPGLVFTSVVPGNSSSQVSSSSFYGIQSTPPIQIIIPSSLAIALGLLVVTCVIALGMMVHLVSRTSISQVLRLSED